MIRISITSHKNRNASRVRVLDLCQRALHGLRYSSAGIQYHGPLGFQHQEEKIPPPSQFPAPVLPESAHARTYLRNPVRARSRRLLPGRPQWQVGLQHRLCAGKISIGQRHERERQTRRAQPAETRPRLEHRGCGRAQTAVAHHSSRGHHVSPCPPPSSDSASVSNVSATQGPSPANSPSSAAKPPQH